MSQEGDDDNDEYYVLIQTISGEINVRPNRFGQASTIALGLLNFQWHAFLQNSRPGE